MWAIIAAILSGPVTVSAAQPNDCLTRHGVTHCWERLGAWDPRENHMEWGRSFHSTPPVWGFYPTEKRE